MVLRRVVCFLFVFTLFFSFCVGGVRASREINARGFASTFLEGVVGIDLDSVRVVKFFASSLRIAVFEGDDRPRKEDYISVVFENGSNRFDASIDLIDGRFWVYRLYLLSGDLGPDRLGFKDCVRAAYKAIEGYRKLYNTGYSAEFSQLLSAVLRNESLTIDLKDPRPVGEPSFLKGSTLLARVDGETGTLEIIYYKRFSRVTFVWYEKIKGRWITPWRSISLHVSLKTGLVIGLGDNMMHYKVATTDVKIFREEAIRIAMPYIQAYALKHLLLIKKIEATFSFENDIGLRRGKDRNGFYMVYPRWSVTAYFDRVTHQNVFAYTVGIWADNGKVYHHGPQGFYSGGAAGPSWPLPAAAAFTATFLTLAIYKRRLKTHKRTQRIRRKNTEESRGEEAVKGKMGWREP